MEIVNSILIPYLLLVQFTSTVMNHGVNFRGASQTFRQLLLIMTLIGLIGILAIIVTIGLKEKWWISVLLTIGGFVISPFIESIILSLLGTDRDRIYILSIPGIIIIPVTLIVIIAKIFF